VPDRGTWRQSSAVKWIYWAVGQSVALSPLAAQDRVTVWPGPASAGATPKEVTWGPAGVAAAVGAGGVVGSAAVVAAGGAGWVGGGVGASVTVGLGDGPASVAPVGVMGAAGDAEAGGEVFSRVVPWVVAPASTGPGSVLVWQAARSRNVTSSIDANTFCLLIQTSAIRIGPVPSTLLTTKPPSRFRSTVVGTSQALGAFPIGSRPRPGAGFGHVVKVPKKLKQILGLRRGIDCLLFRGGDGTIRGSALGKGER
jgi:hypothetical protein